MPSPIHKGNGGAYFYNATLLYEHIYVIKPFSI